MAETGKLPWSIDYEDVHMNIESSLTKLIGQVGKKIHLGRSRNDLVTTDLRLYLRDFTDIYLIKIREVEYALSKMAIVHASSLFPGFTHLQIAQPVTFGHHLLAWNEMMLRDEKRLINTRELMNTMPLGSAALSGTTLKIDRKFVAKKLGFSTITTNSMDAVSDRDYVCDFAYTNSMIMMHLSRICEELVLWMNPQFKLVEIDEGFCTGSSIMPQKKNPDILELTRGKTSQVIGYLTSILTTTKGLPSGYSRDLQQIKSSIWSTSKTSITALIIIKSMLSDLIVNQEKMQKATEDGFLIALDLAENLVLEKIPFRTAHNIVGNLVQLSHNSKKLLSDLELDEIKSLGIKDIKPEKLFMLIQKTTILSSLKQRKSKGSSGTSEQTRMIGQRTRKLVTLKKSIKTQNDSVKKSLTLLEKRVKTLTK